MVCTDACSASPLLDMPPRLYCESKLTHKILLQVPYLRKLPWPELGLSVA